MSKTSKTKTARQNFDFKAWIEADPNAAPSRGQVFAFLMPSKGGLSTGDLRATEAKAQLEALDLPFWTRKGLAQMNDAIRASKERKEAGQAWLTGLLEVKETPAKEVFVKEAEIPEEAPAVVEVLPQDQLIAALAAKNDRLEAEIARLREGVEAPKEVPPGMTFVKGHLRRKR